MKTILWALLAFLLGAGLAEASTKLLWDRNADTTGTTKYHVYSCAGTETTPCVPVKSATPEAVVQQPAATAVPEYLPGSGKSAYYAVTALDAQNNESGLSNIVFFDSTAPSAPANLRLQ